MTNYYRFSSDLGVVSFSNVIGVVVADHIWSPLICVFHSASCLSVYRFMFVCTLYVYVCVGVCIHAAFLHQTNWCVHGVCPALVHMHVHTCPCLPTFSLLYWLTAFSNFIPLNFTDSFLFYLFILSHASSLTNICPLFFSPFVYH